MEGRVGGSLLCYLNAVFPLYKATKKYCPLSSLSALRDGEALFIFLSKLYTFKHFILFYFLFIFFIYRIPEHFSNVTEFKSKDKKKERSHKGYKKQIVCGLNQFYDETFGMKKVYKKKSGSKDKNFLRILTLIFTASIYCDSRNSVIKRILKLSAKVKTVLMVIAKSVTKDAPIGFTTKRDESEDSTSSESDFESESNESTSDESDFESESESESDKKAKKKKERKKGGKGEQVKKKDKGKTAKKKDEGGDVTKKKDDEIKSLKRKVLELEASRDKYKEDYLKAKTISERIFERYKDIGESVIKYEKFQQEKQEKQEEKKRHKKKEEEEDEDEEEDDDDEGDDDDDGSDNSDDDDNDSDEVDNNDDKKHKTSKKVPTLKYTAIDDLESLLD